MTGKHTTDEVNHDEKMNLIGTLAPVTVLDVKGAKGVNTDCIENWCFVP